MKAPSAETQGLAEAVRIWAAYRGLFRPAEAVRQAAGGALPEDELLMARVLSALRADCTVVPTQDGELWEMRPAARRKLLAPERRSADGAAHPPDTPIAQALAGEGAFAPVQLQAMVAEGAPLDALRDTVATLDRAGPSAPGYPALTGLRAALNAALAAARTDDMLAPGFHGREDERARLAHWIADAQKGPPLVTLHVSGLPGIGKSYLLEQAIQDARRDRDPVLVRLDFDRASLDVRDAHAFFEELSRQIGDGLPVMAETLQEARHDSAEEKADLKGRGSGGRLPHRLLDAMSKAVQDGGRPLLVVLDTLEVLRSRGETDVMTLFDHLDRLAEGAAPLQVVSAGRGDALDPVPERVAGHLRLTGLEDSAAERLLEARGVAPALWPRILPLARGNPLLLTLAGKALTAGDFDEASLPRAASDETIGGYLYRAILSRVPERLRRIANEGLILRHVDAEALREVVAPALGLTLDAAEAAAVLEELNAQHWLVQQDAMGRTLHRADVRRAFLPLIYADNPEDCAAIDARAAEVYAHRAPVSALYHRLQLWRSTGELPEVDPALAAEFTEDMLEDLAPRPRDAVRQAQGRRSDFGRASPPDADIDIEAVEDGLYVGSHFPDTADVERGAPPETPQGATVRPRRDARLTDERGTPLFHYDAARRRVLRATEANPAPAGAPDDRAVRDLAMMLRDGAEREAGYVLEHGFAGGFTADSPAGRAVMDYLWVGGRWGNARLMFEACTTATPDEIAAFVLGREGPERRFAAEMLAEFRFDRLARWLKDEKAREEVLALRLDTSRQGVEGLALDMALIAAFDAPQDLIERRALELPLGVLAPWLDADLEAPFTAAWHRAWERRMRAGVALEPRDFDPLGETAGRDRIRLAETLPPLEHRAFAPRLMANLNPYEMPLLARLDDDGLPRPVTEGLPTAGGAIDRLCDWAGMRHTGLDAVKSRIVTGGRPLPHDTAEGLATLGLTADWAEGFTFFNPVPDLPAMAEAAERWRRTAAGLWSYGRTRPRAWRGGSAPDAVAHLIAQAWHGRTAEEMRAALLFWARCDSIGEDEAAAEAQGAATVRRRLGRRYTRASDAAANAREADPLAAALLRLQKDSVPAVLAAPLAAAAAHGLALDDIIGRGSDA